MSIYGHESVDLAKLKEWAKNLDFEHVFDKSKNGLYGQFALEDICKGLFYAFLHSIQDLV